MNPKKGRLSHRLGISYLTQTCECIHIHKVVGLG